MCWLSNLPSCWDTKVAEKDIPIFKILACHHSMLKGWFFNKIYELNEDCPEVGLDILRTYSYTAVYKGYHSYSLSCSTICRDGVIHVASSREIALETYRTNSSRYPIKVLGYIPKGAKYLLNTYGEYVSSKIVLTKVLD